MKILHSAQYKIVEDDSKFYVIFLGARVKLNSSRMLLLCLNTSRMKVLYQSDRALVTTKLSSLGMSRSRWHNTSVKMIVRASECCTLP